MKKIVSLVLVAMLVLSLAPMSLAAGARGWGYGFSAEWDDGEAWEGAAYGTFVNPTDNTIGGLDIVNDTTIQLIDSEGDMLTRGDVIANNIGVTLRVSNGAKVVTGASIVYPDNMGTAEKDDDYAYVQVNFLGEWVSVSAVDYRFQIYVTVAGRRDSSSETTQLTGTYANFEETVTSGDIYVYLCDDVPVVHSLAYIKAMEIELDGSVTIHSRFYEGKKYYATASSAWGSADEAFLDLYNDLVSVHRIKQVNLNNANTTVKLRVDGSLYVYGVDADGNLVYLDKASNKLPFYATYYTASTELDLPEEAVDEPEEEPGDEPYVEPTETGGDEAPANLNDNPGTGC
jgi:hypothetical protein